MKKVIKIVFWMVSLVCIPIDYVLVNLFIKRITLKEIAVWYKSIEIKIEEVIR